MTKKMKVLIGYDGSDCAEAARDDLQRAGLPQIAEARVLKPSGLKVSTEIREGDPRRALVEAAEALNTDSIVGSVGFGNSLERLVLGSVSASVAARAHCSVEVVKTQKPIGGNYHERESNYSSN